MRGLKSARARWKGNRLTAKQSIGPARVNHPQKCNLPLQENGEEEEDRERRGRERVPVRKEKKKKKGGGRAQEKGVRFRRKSAPRSAGSGGLGLWTAEKEVEQQVKLERGKYEAHKDERYFRAMSNCG